MFKHKTILTILALCVVAGAEEKKEEAKIELIPVYEKTFDDTIIDVIFAETKVPIEKALALGWRGLEEIKSEEKTSIIYPKAVIKRGRIEFLNEEGIVKKTFLLFPLKGMSPTITVNYSKDRKYIGIVKSRKEFIMLNDQGDVLWQTDISRVGYGWPYISPDGQYIVCYGDITGDFTDYYPSVWDKDGFVKGLVKEDGRTDYELLYLDFTGNGELFAATFRQRGYTKKEGYLDSLILCLFDRKGNKIWQKVVGKGLARGLSISKDGDYIAVGIRSTDGLRSELHLYNNEGVFLWKSKIGDGECYSMFSHDELVLTVLCGWGFVAQINIQTGQFLWSHQGKGVFRALLPNTEKQIFLIIGFEKGSTGEKVNDFIYIFDKKGKVVGKNKFPPSSLFTKYPCQYIPSPGYYPTVLVSKDKITLLNGKDSGLFSFKFKKMEEK